MAFLKGVYWDFDGTIANTELEAHLPAFNKAFCDFGLNWHWKKSEYIGLLNINGGKNRISYYSRIVSKYLSNESIIEIHKKKQHYYLEYIKKNKVKLKTGVYRLIKELHTKNIRQFIVTSSSKLQVDILNQYLFPEFNPFEFIISSDDVHFCKPNPYPYLKAISMSGINPSNSIVFEDSNTGIKSALDAKLPIIYVPSNIPTVIDKKVKLNCIVDTLGDEKRMANVIKGPKLNKKYIDFSFLNNYSKLFCDAKY